MVQRAGGRAWGCRQRRRHDPRHAPPVDGQDVGRVGKVIGVDPSPIPRWDAAGFVPVIAPLGVDEKGSHPQRQRRRGGGAIASALGAEKLILLTDVEGVKDGSGKLIHSLTVAEARS